MGQVKVSLLKRCVLTCIDKSCPTVVLCTKAYLHVQVHVYALIIHVHIHVILIIQVSYLKGSCLSTCTQVFAVHVLTLLSEVPIC